jgi:hypothetical protein
MRQVILYASMYDTWENNDPIGWFCLKEQFYLFIVLNASLFVCFFLTKCVFEREAGLYFPLTNYGAK